MVVARCEYHPTPACPQTRITGVPGSGPETRTADELLADAQHELDDALAAREQRAPEVDATIARDERALTDARTVTGGDVGLGGRWLAMNDVTLASPGALTLRLATIAACALLYLLPLILGLWRGQTTDDRRASARVERERADLEADTAIAVKRAEIRREAEILWAEHQLTQARLAIEAQLEIDREQQRRRVQETLDEPVRASAQRRFEPVDEEIFLPIAAEAEAASRAVTQPPVRADTAEAELVPAQVHSPAAPHGEGGTSIDPVGARRHQGRGPLDSPPGADLRRAGDRHHDPPLRTGLRRGRGDHLLAQANSQGVGRHRERRRTHVTDRSNGPGRPAGGIRHRGKRRPRAWAGGRSSRQSARAVPS